jgi:hypothetical protein
LTCAECGRQQTEGERGWRAYVTVDDADDPEPVEAAVLCPDCAAREFGAPPASRRRCRSATSRQRLRRTELPERRRASGTLPRACAEAVGWKRAEP